MSTLTILLGFLATFVKADCEATSQDVVIPAGAWKEYCCTGLSGTSDVSYDALFHSVNNDAFTTTALVADDSGQTGICTGGAGGPSPYWMSAATQYADNFPHTEKFYEDGSGGKYISVQNSFRLGCTTPGSGDSCEISLDHLKLCAGPSCSFSLGDHNASKAMNALPSPGAFTVMKSVPTSGVPVAAKDAQAAGLSCDQYCQSGGHGRGTPIGTAPFCGASCAGDCSNGQFCQEPWSEGSGCATGHKICCCAQP